MGFLEEEVEEGWGDGGWDMGVVVGVRVVFEEKGGFDVLMVNEELGWVGVELKVQKGGRMGVGVGDGEKVEDECVW
uniref:hypothetical protein n=1 Tax=Siminovitchia fortis TaxID=254758 RepID=UPI0011A61973